MKEYRKEYRAVNISYDNDSDIITKLDILGISPTMYRINYYNNEKEIVAEKKIAIEIKKIIEHV